MFPSCGLGLIPFEACCPSSQADSHPASFQYGPPRGDWPVSCFVYFWDAVWSAPRLCPRGSCEAFPRLALGSLILLSIPESFWISTQRNRPQNEMKHARNLIEGNVYMKNKAGGRAREMSGSAIGQNSRAAILELQSAVRGI